MNDITSTPEGRIFLAGADEALYELVYRQFSVVAQQAMQKGSTQPKLVVPFAVGVAIEGIGRIEASCGGF